MPCDKKMKPGAKKMGMGHGKGKMAPPFKKAAKPVGKRKK